jgi:hypothetical protein
MVNSIFGLKSCEYSNKKYRWARYKNVTAVADLKRKVVAVLANAIRRLMVIIWVRSQKQRAAASPVCGLRKTHLFACCACYTRASVTSWMNHYQSLHLHSGDAASVENGVRLMTLKLFFLW